MLVKTSDLKNMCESLARVVPSRSALPAALCVELWGEFGKLCGYAINTGGGISATLNIDASGELPKVLVENTLLKVAPFFDGDMTELKVDETHLLTNCGNTKTKHRLSNEEIPHITGEFATNHGSISASTLSAINAAIVPLTDASAKIAMVQSVMFDDGYVYATNGIAVARVSCPELDNLPFVSLLAGNVVMLARLGVDFEVQVAESALKFTSPRAEIICNATGIQRMDLPKLFVSDDANIISDIDTNAMLLALRAAAIYTENRVVLDIEPDRILLSAGGEFSTEVACYSAISEQVLLDVSRLILVMRAMGKTCEMHLVSPMKPALFVGDCEYVLFPMHY